MFISMWYTVRRSLAGAHIEIQMRHGVAADHHGHVGRAREEPRMRHGAIAGLLHDFYTILMRRHAGVPVVAHDPQTHVIPPAFALGIGANLRRGIVDDGE